MSYKDHLHDQQFLPARTLMDHTQVTPADFDDSMSSMYDSLGLDRDDFWADVHEEAEYSGLIESIAKDGVHTPVEMVNSKKHGMLLNDGHHRVVAAHTVDPDTPVPINVTEGE